MSTELVGNKYNENFTSTQLRNNKISLLGVLQKRTSVANNTPIPMTRFRFGRVAKYEREILVRTQYANIISYAPNVYLAWM